MGESPPQSFGPIHPFFHLANLIFLQILPKIWSQMTSKEVQSWIATHISGILMGESPPESFGPIFPFFHGANLIFLKILPKIWSQMTSKEVRSWIATHISCILMGESPPQSFGPIHPFFHGANLIFLQILPKILKKNEACLMKKELYGSETCLLYTSPSPRDKRQSRMPSSA